MFWSSLSYEILESSNPMNEQKYGHMAVQEKMKVEVVI